MRERQAQYHRSMLPDRQTPSPSETKISYRLATAEDAPRLIPMINAAFSIEEFLEGTRTDEVRLAEMMEKGSILMAEDEAGKLLGSSVF